MKEMKIKKHKRNIDSFHIISQVGKGRFGQVYKAVHR